MLGILGMSNDILDILDQQRLEGEVSSQKHRESETGREAQSLCLEQYAEGSSLEAGHERESGSRPQQMASNRARTAGARRSGP